MVRRWPSAAPWSSSAVSTASSSTPAGRRAAPSPTIDEDAWRKRDRRNAAQHDPAHPRGAAAPPRGPRPGDRGRSCRRRFASRSRASSPRTCCDPGLAGLIKSLVTEIAPIRINGVAPGPVRRRTGFAVSTRRGRPRRARRSRTIQAQTRARIPLGRYGDPDELGRVVAFLLSPAASYLDGVILAGRRRDDPEPALTEPFRLAGVFSVLPTAFHDDGALDLDGHGRARPGHPRRRRGRSDRARRDGRGRRARRGRAARGPGRCDGRGRGPARRRRRDRRHGRTSSARARRPLPGRARAP